MLFRYIALSFDLFVFLLTHFDCFQCANHWFRWFHRLSSFCYYLTPNRDVFVHFPNLKNKNPNREDLRWLLNTRRLSHSRSSLKASAFSFSFLFFSFLFFSFFLSFFFAFLLLLLLRRRLLRLLLLLFALIISSLISHLDSNYFQCPSTWIQDVLNSFIYLSVTELKFFWLCFVFVVSFPPFLDLFFFYLSACSVNEKANVDSFRCFYIDGPRSFWKCPINCCILNKALFFEYLNLSPFFFTSSFHSVSFLFLPLPPSSLVSNQNSMNWFGTHSFLIRKVELWITMAVKSIHQTGMLE